MIEPVKVIAPIATELPEKFNSVIWIRGGKDTLAMGNITGAMVFQSCIPTVIGLVFAASAWRIDTSSPESLLAFASIALSRRILWFPLWSQALHVAALLLFAQGVSALVRMAAGAEFPGWSIAVGPLVGAALWPVVSLLLLLPQRMPASVDDTRTI